MYLYSKDYSAKGGHASPKNSDHYVIVDAGSGAEKQYRDMGWAPNAQYDDNLAVEDEKTQEQLDKEATEAAERKLNEENAQRIAAEALAIKSGVAATPNDQSVQTPKTETPAAAAIKEAGAVAAPVVAAVAEVVVEANKEADAAKAKADADAEAAKAKAAEAATKAAEKAGDKK